MAGPALKLADDTRRKPPERFTFTQKRLAAVKPPAKGRKWCYDDRQPGLAMMTTATGHRAFYYYRKMKGEHSPVREKIGDVAEWTIEKARARAAEHAHEQHNGRHPAEKRRVQRGEMTLGQLRALYVEEHAKHRNTERTRTVEDSLYKLTLERWHNRKLSTIKPHEVAKLHAEVGRDRSRTSANRAIQYLRRLFRYAAKHYGYEGRNPAESVDLFKETSRERFLTADELPRFFEALRHEDEIFQHFFELALLTGARRSNLQAAQWQHISLKARTWTIPGDESKNAAPMTIPLVKRATAILRLRRLKQAKAAEGGGLPAYVFPAVRRKRSPHMGQPIQAWRRICERAGIEGLTPHDLRRSAGAWQAIGGASLPIIGRSLGHRDSRATQIYARLSDDPVRASMEAAAKAMRKGGK